MERNSQPRNSVVVLLLESCGSAVASFWLVGRRVGSVGVAGSTSYSNGTFTVSGSGQWIYGSADGMHFAYVPLSGDGTIIARLAGVQGGGAQTGVMVRETLDADSTYAFVNCEYASMYFFYRSSTGGGTSYGGGASVTLPSWMKLVRSGNTFSAYSSVDRVNWTQQGSTQTISMAQNVYLGLAISSESNSSLATATFDSVSISSGAITPPAISGLSATTGSVGSQLIVSGSGFGSSQGSSVLALNGTSATINAWADTSITATIPTGATTGFLEVLLAPSMNASNPLRFEVTSQPLPAGWLDLDLGSVAVVGGATFASGVFTVTGSGNGFGGTADGFHFVYQPWTGDGTFVARVVSQSSPSNLPEAGVMIRSTLDAGSANAVATDYANSIILFYRATAGGNTSSQQNTGTPPPMSWVKLVRAGSVLTGYSSADGENWAQIGSSETIALGTNVFVGLAMSAESTTSAGAAAFDNVSLSSSASPAPEITSLSASTGAIGSQVVIYGSGFGTSQGSNVALLNDTALTVSTWTATSITATIPAGATTGPFSGVSGSEHE